MTLSERDRKALKMGVIGVALIASYILAIEPMAKAYANLQADHDRIAAKVARAMHNVRKVEYYTQRLAEYEEAVGELSPARPYDEQISSTGEQIITAAQQGGVQLQGFTPTAGVVWADDPTLQTVMFRIDAEADWGNVFKFIRSLYRIPGVLSVESLDLSSDPEKGGKIKMGMTISALAKNEWRRMNGE